LRPWSSEELKQLRALAGERVPVEVIATRLRRSVSAVRNKAGLHGISLTSRPRRTSEARSDRRPESDDACSAA
jgi:hypothetical protein